MAGPASVVAIDITVNPRNAIAGFKAIQEESERTAKLSTQHFEKATSSIGTTFSKLDQQLASFGVPFAGALTAVGGSLDKASKSGEGLHGTLSSIGAVTTIAAAAGLAVVGSVSVKAALDFEQAHARLVEVVGDAGQNFSAYGDKISATDKQLEGFGFTNTETENAMSRLTVATKDVGKTTELMGLAADIARARNLSLQDATDILTRAEAGRFLQLTRLGIVSKETAATFRNSADAIAYLTAAYGGQASAFADTYAGKLAKLHATVTDLSVGIGESLIPVLSGLATTAVEAVQGFQDINSASGGALGKIVLFGAAIPVAVFAADKLVAVGSRIGDAFSSAATRLAGTGTVTAAAIDQETAALAANVAAKGESITADSLISAMNEKRVAELLAVQEAEQLEGATRLAMSRAGSASAAAVVTAEGSVATAEGLVSGAIAERIAAEANLDAAIATHGEASAEAVAASEAVVVAYGEEAAAAQLAATANLELAAAEKTAASVTAADGVAALVKGLGAALVGLGAGVIGLNLAAKAADAVGISFGNVEQHRFDTVTDSINKLGRAGVDSGLIADTFGTHWEKAKSALDSIGDQSLADKAGKVVTHFNALIGSGSSAKEELGSDKAVRTIDSSLADMVRTGGEAGGVATATFEQIYSHAIAAGVGVDTLKKSFNDYYAAVKESGELNAANLAQGRLTVAKQAYEDLLKQPEPATGTPAAAEHDKALAAARTDVVIASREVVGVQPEVNAAVQEGADASDAAATAAFNQSDALKDLKSSLVQNDFAGIRDATGRLNDAVIINTRVEQEADAAMAHAKAVADSLTGSVITLGDAYEYLGLTANKDAVSSLNAINSASFDQFDANQAVTSSTEDLNSALADLKNGNNGAAGSSKSAAAAAIEHQQKVLALRDALIAVGDQEGKIKNAQQGLADAQRGLGDARRDQREKVLALSDAERQYEIVLHGVARGSKEAQDAAEALEKSRLDIRSRTLDVKDAQSSLREARANVVDVSQFGDPQEVADAKEKVQRAQIALAESRLAQGDSVKTATEAERVYNGTMRGFTADSKEATDAQKALTAAQREAVSANQAVVSAHQQVTAAALSLRDANNQTATAALGLVRAQADVDGALESSGKKVDDYKKKLSEVESKAATVAKNIGTSVTDATGSVSQGILAQIGYLRDVVAANPLLKGAFDEVLGKLQKELLQAPDYKKGGPATTPVQPGRGGTGRPYAAEGGWVTGAVGEPVPMVLHGGEYIVSVAELKGRPRADSPFAAGPAIPHAAEGGWIPGTPGEPAPIVAHGGEYVVSVAELQGQPRADSPFHDFLTPTAPQTAGAVATGTTPATLRGGATPGPTQLPTAFNAAGSGLVTSFSEGIKDQWVKVVEPFFTGMHRAVLGHFDGARDWLRQPGTDIMAGFNEALVTGWAPISAFFDTLPNLLRAKTASAVAATGDSWQGIKGAFAVPVIWSITNVLNPLIGDVDAIAAALGMKPIMAPIAPIKGFHEGGIVDRDQVAQVHAGEGVIPAAAMQNLTTEQFENLRAGSSPVRGYATGGTVDSDQTAQLHAGEGVLPKAAMLTLTPQQFEKIRVGARLEDIFVRNELTDKALGSSPIGKVIGGLDKAASADVASYLQAIPDPTAIGGGITGPGAGAGTGIYRYTGDQQTEFLDAIILHESGGNPKAMNPYGEWRNGVFYGASGLFQFLHDSWNHYGGYEWAALAPVDTQWEHARAEVASFVNQYHANDPRLWSVGWYGGVGVMQQIMRGEKTYADGPGGVGNPLTYGQFANWIVADMPQFAADKAPAGQRPASGSIASLHEWAGKQGSYRALEAYMAQSGVPATVSSDVRPGAITANGFPSRHGQNRAVDFVGPSLINIWRAWEDVKSAPLDELFYSRAPTFISDGGQEFPIGLMRPNDYANHFSHVHVALEEGGVVNFPKAGAPAVLHGNELVAPLPPNFDLAATLRRSGSGSGSTTTIKNYTINVASLDPRQSRTLVLSVLKEVERTEGFVPIRVGSG